MKAIHAWSTILGSACKVEWGLKHRELNVGMLEQNLGYKGQLILILLTLVKGIYVIAFHANMSSPLERDESRPLRGF